MEKSIKNVTIYTQPNCEFCERAKNLLHSREEYVIYEIDISNKPEMKKLVVENLGTTVPQIVINGWHIGGYNDLERYLQ